MIPYLKPSFALIAILSVCWALYGCETFQAISNVEKPQTYKETIFVLEEDIKAARDVTALLARNGTISRDQAKIISLQTKDMLSYITTIWVAINLVGGDLSKCKLNYEGVELPCNTASDKMLFLLLKIQAELKVGEAQ